MSPPPSQAGLDFLVLPSRVAVLPIPTADPNEPQLVFPGPELLLFVVVRRVELLVALPEAAAVLPLVALLLARLVPVSS